MDDAAADEPAGGFGSFGEGDGQGADGVKGGARLRHGRASMGEDGIEPDMNADGGERPRPRPPHGVRHGDAHRTGFGDVMLVEALHEPLEILDGDAPAFAAPRHRSEVGSVEAKFGHAHAHPRRDITRARCIRRHRQPPQHRLDPWLVRLREQVHSGRSGNAGSPRARSPDVPASGAGGRLFRQVDPCTLRFLHRHLEVAKGRTHRHNSRPSTARISETRPAHGTFTPIVAFCVSTSMISWSAGNVLTHGDPDMSDRRLGDRLTELGHHDGNKRHGGNELEPFRRAAVFAGPR